MWEKYIFYLKDNPNNYWFKRKLYGFGWTPVKWQGWFTILAFMAFTIWNAILLDSSLTPTSGEITWFITKTVLGIIILIYICFKKGETPKWQWGIPKDEKKP